MMRGDQPVLLAALEGRWPERLPVWFMRQAGRSLPECRSTGQGTAMLDTCFNPELAAEIACQPACRYGVDAAVSSSDIMIPLALVDVEMTITTEVGPVFGQPVSGVAEVNRLVERRIPNTSVVEKAVTLAVAELGEDTSVVGFAGAPFTLATYLVGGRGSRDHLGVRTFMHAESAVWDRLPGWCADLPGKFLRIQVATRVRAVRLFDS